MTVLLNIHLFLLSSSSATPTADAKETQQRVQTKVEAQQREQDDAENDTNHDACDRAAAEPAAGRRLRQCHVRARRDRRLERHRRRRRHGGGCDARALARRPERRARRVAVVARATGAVGDALARHEAVLLAGTAQR